MDFAWTAEQLALRDGVASFAEDLNDDIVERDRTATFPRDAWKRCAEFGMQSMPVSSVYNTSGVDTDMLSAALAMEAFGYGCRDNGLGLALAAHMWTVAHPISVFGSEDQKGRYLAAMCAGDLIGAHAVTEREAGSDHMALQTIAEPVEGGYRLTGIKQFITLGPIADLALVFATVDPSKGRWGLTAFIVETDWPGCEPGPPREKMGLRTVPLGDLVFDGCFVPEANRLGTEGAGASIASSALGVERCFVLANQVGATQRQLEEAVQYAKTRHQFNRPIGKFQSVSNRVADMRLALEISQLLLYKVAWMLANGKSVTLEAALLKLHLAESFVSTSLDAIRIHGGKGYLTETEVERDLRDAVGGLIYAGTSDIQRVLIARMIGL